MVRRDRSGQGTRRGVSQRISQSPTSASRSGSAIGASRSARRAAVRDEGAHVRGCVPRLGAVVEHHRAPGGAARRPPPGLIARQLQQPRVGADAQWHQAIVLRLELQQHQQKRPAPAQARHRSHAYRSGSRKRCAVQCSREPRRITRQAAMVPAHVLGCRNRVPRARVGRCDAIRDGERARGSHVPCHDAYGICRHRPGCGHRRT